MKTLKANWGKIEVNKDKIILWWLALVFNNSNNLLKKSYVEFGKFIYSQKSKKMKKNI